ncbi:MAG: site-specific integrase [Acidobacteriota bacterium]|nr:site-specific integrase [Acidobacteriota bacterium]
MLRDLFLTEQGLRRHLQTPIGIHLDGYLTSLATQGYSPESIGNHLRFATAFGEYLVSCGRALNKLRSSDLENFLAWYQCATRHHGPRRITPKGSLSLQETLCGVGRKLFGYLRLIGAVPPKDQLKPETPYDSALEEYLSFLRIHRGFADLTINLHRYWGRAFFAALAVQQPPVALTDLTSENVENAVVLTSDRLGTRFRHARSRQILRSTVKSMVRYFKGTGCIPSICAPFLPKRKSYALAPLPSAIAWTDIERAVQTIDRSTKMGIRDYALMMLLATYALRASEIAELSLDDIDWRNNVLHIRQRKTRRSLDLPLVPQAAESVIAYLRDSRPISRERRLFLKCQAPAGPITTAILYNVVRKALVNAGVKAEHYGSHSIRHACATSLLRRGETLKTIGDILGHRVPEATLIYCKLAVEDLRSVALDIPEVES